MDDFVNIIMYSIGGLVLLTLFVVFGLVYPISYISCNNAANVLGIKAEFGLTTGCIYTLKDGRKIDSDHYIVNDSNK